MTKATVTGLKLDVEGNFSTIDITEGLTVLQEAVDGIITGIAFGDDLYAYGNDEGLYTQPLNPFATALYTHKWGAFYQPIHGAVVFVGGHDGEGNTKSAPETLEAELKALIHYPS